MEPRRDPPRRSDDEAGPTIEPQDWDAIEGREILPDSVPSLDDAGYDIESDAELPEEDDDNPAQESDEALPDDDEERALAERLGGRGIRYEPE